MYNYMSNILFSIFKSYKLSFELLWSLTSLIVLFNICYFPLLFLSLQLSCSVMSDSLQPRGLKCAKLPCPSPTPGACSNSCPSSRWCHPTISSSVVPFSRLQSFPTSGSSPRSQFFTSGGQSIGVSASASVLPMNIQDWFPFELTDWFCLQSKGLSRVRFLWSSTLTSIHDHWKKHSFD